MRSLPARVKICGITCAEDAQLAASFGAWALGFIFAPMSPRHIAPKEAAAVSAAVGHAVEKVGVFVDATLEAIRDAVKVAGLTIVQLHGTESRALCEALRADVRDVWKAIRVGDVLPEAELTAFEGCTLLLDTLVRDMAGGTGKSFPWHLAREARRFGRVIVAGGLTPENVVDAIRAAEPYAVDVGSGVELRPGKKDPAKLARFFEAVRGVQGA